ncbi:MAG: hypothetical protein ABI839_01345 [Verrucomicrobiota bacterium]
MTVIAYWLLPAEKNRAFLAWTIEALSLRFGAPVFEPHLTLLVVPENSPDPGEVLTQLAPVEMSLPILGVGQSKEFTQTLFVRFEPTAALARLVKRLQTLAQVRSGETLQPHLSLLYQTLPEVTRDELTRTVVLPFAEVSFAGVCAVRCPSPTANAAHVRSWQIVAEKRATKSSAVEAGARILPLQK